MAAFQTLRENGLLPMVEIDKDGGIREYIDDFEDLRECPWEIDQDSLKQKRMNSCRKKAGIVKDAYCDPQTGKDCRPGYHSYYKDDGPLLWLAKDMGVAKKWAHMFNAISKNIRTWESLAGSCFKEIYIGKSNVISYYMPLYIDPDDEEIDLATVCVWMKYSIFIFCLLI